MITAEEARRLSGEKYNKVSNEIERIARNGGHEYCYKNFSPMPNELYEYLVENGYRVIFKEEIVYDEDHYGEEIEGTERTLYCAVISWW